MVDGLLLKVEAPQATGGLKVAHHHRLNGEGLVVHRGGETRALNVVDQGDRTWPTAAVGIRAVNMAIPTRAAILILLCDLTSSPPADDLQGNHQHQRGATR